MRGIQLIHCYAAKTVHVIDDINAALENEATPNKQFHHPCLSNNLIRCSVAKVVHVINGVNAAPEIKNTTTEHSHQLCLFNNLEFSLYKKPKKLARKRKSSDSVTNSNKLKCIATSLMSKNFKHMLYWTNFDKKEFEIVFVHRSSPIWNPSYLDLFEELDKLSKNFKKYKEDEKYDCSTKARCKASLRKFCETKDLDQLEESHPKKSVTIKKYKFNAEFSIFNALQKGETTDENNMEIYGPSLQEVAQLNLQIPQLRNVSTEINYSEASMNLDKFCIPGANEVNTYGEIMDWEKSSQFGENEKSFNKNDKYTQDINDNGESIIEEHDLCQSFQWDMQKMQGENDPMLSSAAYPNGTGALQNAVASLEDWLSTPMFPENDPPQ